jgi:mannose-6-phosphate isomerase-like protein (cupin superfamily)
MFIKKEDSLRKTKAKSCIVWEYDFKRKNIDLAVAKISGRYPEGNKKVVNMACNMIYYVVSGNGTIHHETGDFWIKSEDSFFFEKNTWYWVEGNNLVVAMFSCPAWFIEQYKEIE